MKNADESYTARENQWDQQWPSGSTEGRSHVKDETDNEDELMPFPGSVGTTDPIEAVRDAEPYTPPIDPPVLPSGDEGISVATGFGLSAEEEAAEDPLPRGDLDIEAQAIETLRQDSLISHYGLDVDVNDGVVRLKGAVPSIDDADHAMSIVDELPGVVEVIDDTTLDPTLTS